QYFHSREIEFFHQIVHILIQRSQVFSDERHFWKLFRHRFKKPDSRGFYPLPILCCLFFRWYFPDCRKSPEMVKSHHIEQEQVLFEAGDPPFEILCFQTTPVINGSPPQLSICAEKIRRYPRYLRWKFSVVQFEKLWVRPAVGAL